MNAEISTTLDYITELIWRNGGYTLLHLKQYPMGTPSLYSASSCVLALGMRSKYNLIAMSRNYILLFFENSIPLYNK
jgi:hypothetical protein